MQYDLLDITMCSLPKINHNKAGTLEAILSYVQMYIKIVNRQIFIASSNFLMSAILTTLAHTSLICYYYLYLCRGVVRLMLGMTGTRHHYT